MRCRFGQTLVKPESAVPGRPPYRGRRGCGGVNMATAGADFHGRDRLGLDNRPLAAPVENRHGPVPAGRLLSASGALDGLFALGLLLSPSSRLRLHGSPIGPGEFCLLIWLVLMVGRQAAQLGRPLTPSFTRLLVFWALFAIALSIGTMTAYAIQDSHDPVWFMHDVVAYPLLASVSCLSTVEPDAGAHLHRAAWFLVVFASGSLALQLVDAWGLLGAGADESWYWNRLRGWSQNPAQLAFLCAALGLLTFHLAETASRAVERLAAAACAIMPLFVGWLTKTDAFTLVIVAAGMFFIMLKFRTWLLLRGRDMTFRTAAAWIALLAVPLVLGSAALLAPSITARTAVLAKAMSKDEGKTTDQEARLRFELWSAALSRGVQSGMLGLGPGPHLPIPPSIVAGRLTEVGQPKDDPHPQANNTPNFEAHDTVLDLFTQGGLLAVLSFLWFVTTAFFATYKARLAGLTTLLGGLLLFSAFDLIIRYPIFWYSISLCLVAGFEARRTGLSRNGH
jgi:O-Antigen ligase